MNDGQKFMDVEEIAAYLKVSPNTIYWWVATKRIPHHKIGKLVRFEPERVASWLQRNCCDSAV